MVGADDKLAKRVLLVRTVGGLQGNCIHDGGTLRGRS